MGILISNKNELAVRVAGCRWWCWVLSLAVRGVETGCGWAPVLGAGGCWVLVRGAVSWLCALWTQGAGAGCAPLRGCGSLVNLTVPDP